MLFTTAKFLIFFPLVSLVYFLLGTRYKRAWLLICSYYFYMCWNPKYIVLIVFSTVVTYLCGRLVEKYRENGRLCRLFVGLSFALNLSMLIFFKYFDFLFVNLQHLAGLAGVTLVPPAFDIVLPVGISFFTFQAVGYTVDVYRNDIPAEKSLLRYALFVSFFPQLVAGPIERSGNLLRQIQEDHSFDFDRMCRGLQIAAIGFFEKLVISDRAAILANRVFSDYTSYSGSELMVGAIFFAIQIYCDFSGYSHIAIGTAKILGFDLMKNFDHPYLSMSVKEFWRRWHISLSTWFRDYLYIPLGGSRCSKLKKYRNILITFLVSGLWHGAGWKFVVWGGLHGVYQILEDIFLPKIKRLADKTGMKVHTGGVRLARMLLTFCAVDFAWIFFRADSMRDAVGIIARIFCRFQVWNLLDGSVFQLGLKSTEWTVLILGLLIVYATYVIEKKQPVGDFLAKQNICVRWIIYYGMIFGIIIFGIYGSAFNVNNFIYFQF